MWKFATWPHLTAKAVRKHFPVSDETSKGHMKNVKQGIRSPKKKGQDNIPNKQKRKQKSLDQLKKNMIFFED